MSEINFCDYFYYDETSPSCLRWKVDREGLNGKVILVRAGDAVATVNHANYYIGTLFRKVFRVHRMIWTLFNGAIADGVWVDHIDRDKSNNKISNLRLATTASNGQNCLKQSNNSSGVTGVSCKTVKGKAIAWMAGWQEDGEWHSKNFSIFQFGYEKAFEMACNFRSVQIARLNMLGAKYTANHGT